MPERGHPTKSEPIESSTVPAVQVARDTPALHAPNGISYASFGDNAIDTKELERIVQAVPVSIAQALTGQTYYFVPLALAETRSAPSAGHRGPREETMIASAYSTDLADLAICHRNVPLAAGDGVFISTRLMNDRFSLSFEFFINVGHAFVDAAGVPASFIELAWNQAVADVRGETSQDAWESRNLALGTGPTAVHDGKPRIDEKSKNEFLESAFSDAVAIYLLSLATDFDYSELREREYPLLAPQALAERLRLTARLLPPNPSYEFAIRYRRRA